MAFTGNPELDRGKMKQRTQGEQKAAQSGSQWARALLVLISVTDQLWDLGQFTFNLEYLIC